MKIWFAIFFVSAIFTSACNQENTSNEASGDQESTSNEASGDQENTSNESSGPLFVKACNYRIFLDTIDLPKVNGTSACIDMYSQAECLERNGITPQISEKPCRLQDRFWLLEPMLLGGCRETNNEEIFVRWQFHDGFVPDIAGMEPGKSSYEEKCLENGGEYVEPQPTGEEPEKVTGFHFAVDRSISNYGAFRCTEYIDMPFELWRRFNWHYEEYYAIFGRAYHKIDSNCLTEVSDDALSCEGSFEGFPLKYYGEECED